ncbi:MAG: radical SAM protein [Candidatus Gastranaerophilales bacterium]|nr:radical SAM protein [Candidatus Gastranaerophilales bacterium]
MQLTYKAPCCELSKLEIIWLQLSNIACNLKCKHCFLNCYQDFRKRNFLQVEKIFNELQEAELKDLKKIILTGGEPFIHKKINDIIKLCLNYAPVEIHSNGTLLNEKKIKVLKQIQNSYANELSFRLSLDHFTEGRNDEYRARGVFKKVVNAIINLQKYNFKVQLACINIKHESEEVLLDGFSKLFEREGIHLPQDDIKILPMLYLGDYAKYYNISKTKEVLTPQELADTGTSFLDCKNSRVLSIDGVFSCPALVNDPRGRLGDSIHDVSKKVYLETQTCVDCVKKREKLFG